VQQHAYSFEFAPLKLRNDREFVMEAVKKNVWVLPWASEKFKADREIVLEAVRKYSAALKWASEELRDDKEVVLEAVRGGGWSAAQYAGDVLKEEMAQRWLESVEQ
jgi:hypothetical protein